MKQPSSDKPSLFRGNYILIGLFVIVIIFIAGSAMFLLHSDKPGWSDQEIDAFVHACKSGIEDANDPYNLNQDQLSVYCECVYSELVQIFPDGPSMQLLAREDSERIMSGCFKKAKPENS